ncbi:MAG TPA: hypothetical protein PLU64_11290, partial [Saprospiraceae bacterium]|nr:hypothetical protein [Saprospiraceae bacterium]
VYTLARGKHVGHDDTVSGECVRVWVIDDQATFRRATAATLAAMDGFVMAGEVGVVKRDIAFSGDVLNTAARIQSKCNELGVNILFSQFLLDKLSLPPHSFEPKKIGGMLLRGKQEQVVLYTV